jgi:8-oxo-dGTP pyrophosphatase MutT (NUDIX family)
MKAMSFEPLISKLRTGLEQPLPGRPSQLKMAPFTRINSPLVPDGVVPRESGVLVLLYPKEGRVYTVLMLRPNYNGVHSGQVSFPGGKRESFDTSIAHTALREANEELGVVPQDVTVLGGLTELYIPPSNAWVTPTVGYVNNTPVFSPDEREVEEIIEVDLTHFLMPEIRKMMDVTTFRGVLKDTPYYALNDFKIWGATAMMLSELMELICRTNE